MEIKRSLHVLGAAWGIGAKILGTELAPGTIQGSEYWGALEDKGLALYWEEMIALSPHRTGKSNTLLIAESCQKLARATQAFARLKQFFMVVGGDNTCSIGTWSGAQAAIADQGELGLIWIDAHLDSHTPETTESGALHGMPLAALLGHGDPLFTQVIHAQPKVQPENVCIIGARSYEKGELALLERLGVRMFFVEEVHEKGIETVFREALTIVRKNTVGYGICIDLDAIDPPEVPGVGSPEPNGIGKQALLDALSVVSTDSRLLGFEIAEFNPTLDQGRITEKVVCDLAGVLSIGHT